MRAYSFVELEQSLNLPTAVLMHIAAIRQPHQQTHQNCSPIISLISRARRHRLDILHPPSGLRTPFTKMRTKQRRKDRLPHPRISTINLNRNQLLPRSSRHPRHVFEMWLMSSRCMQGRSDVSANVEEGAKWFRGYGSSMQVHKCN